MDNITRLQFTPGEINESRTDLISHFLSTRISCESELQNCHTESQGVKERAELWSCAVNKDKRVKSSHSAPAKRKKVCSSAMVSHVD